MYFNTLGQYKIFLIFLIVGFVTAIIFNFSKTINMIFHGNLIVKNIMMFLSTIFAGIIFFITVELSYYGQVRFYMILTYILGIAIEEITLGKVIAKIMQMLYTYIVKLISGLKKTKVVKRLTK